MKLGAEPKKVAMLGGLMAVAAVALYMNVFSTGETAPPPSPSKAPLLAALPQTEPQASAPAAPGAAAPSRPRARVTRIPEFRPSLKPSADSRIDWSKVDPSLRQDLLARLQSVSLEGHGRNLFEFSAAPPPPAPKLAAAAKPDPKIIPGPIGGIPPASVAANIPPADPPKPMAPPIPLKFYGYISAPKGGQRRGFFLDGEDIVVAAEGETIKRRYKVVQIRLTGAEMEDTQFSQRQTLRLEEPAS